MRAPATTRIDRAAAALLALLAIVHTAVGVADGAALTERRLWFLAGGLALALAAALNIVATSAALRRDARWVVLVGNLALLAFVLAYAAVAGVGQPQGWLLVALAAWVTVRSAQAVTRAPH